MTWPGEPPCGVLAHRMGRWDDVVLGIWWCEDCGEAIWVTEGVEGERRASGDGTRVGDPRSAAAALPRVREDAPDAADASRAPAHRTPDDDVRVSQLHGRVWSLIYRAVSR